MFYLSLIIRNKNTSLTTRSQVSGTFQKWKCWVIFASDLNKKKDNKLAFPKKEGMLRLEKIDKTMYSFLETEKVLVKIPSPGVSR